MRLRTVGFTCPGILHQILLAILRSGGLLNHISSLFTLQSLQTWFVEERRDMDDEKYGAIRRLKKDGKFKLSIHLR